MTDRPTAEERRAERFVADWYYRGTKPCDLKDEAAALKEWLVESFAAHAHDAARAEGFRAGLDRAIQECDRVPEAYRLPGTILREYRNGSLS